MTSSDFIHNTHCRWFLIIVLVWKLLEAQCCKFKWRLGSKKSYRISEKIVNEFQYWLSWQMGSRYVFLYFQLYINFEKYIKFGAMCTSWSSPLHKYTFRNTSKIASNKTKRHMPTYTKLKNKYIYIAIFCVCLRAYICVNE